MHTKTDPLAPPVKPLSLARARCGQWLKIVELAKNCATTSRLRELGFCESAEIRKISDGSAMICHLLGTRVAIGRELGASILVEPLLH